MTRASRLSDVIPRIVRGRASDDTVPVQAAILALSVVLIPVLMTAFLMLYVFPDVGTRLFAWPIGPLMSSMMLGATYLGGVYFFTAVLLSRRWQYFHLGFLPISAFAGTLGIATLLHWDAFAHDRLAFWVWTVLYVAVPLVLPVLWYRNRRLTADAPLDREGELPTVVRWAFGVLGTVLTVAAVLLFVVPEFMVAVWPWTLSALTARTMAAMFVLPGLLGVSFARDGSWSGARYVLQAQAIAIVLMVAAAVSVASADFDWSHPASWTFVGGLGLVLALVAVTYGLRLRDSA